jgi:nitric oxide reductase NorQ protein
MSADKCPYCGESLKSKQHAASHLWSKHRVKWSDFLKQYPNFSSLAAAPPTPRTQRTRTLNDYASPTASASSTPPAMTPQAAQPVDDDVKFYDWGNFLQTLELAYRAGLFVLIIGPKGTGKTTLVRAFAKKVGKPLYSINFSLRTRESHLVGSLMMENGSTRFALGIIPKSMQEGAILYLDELNAAEADVLLRLDEALDDRRQLVIKEAGEPITIKAHPEWFVIATINPLTHAGTKELPPQLLSRFPVRIYVDYPPPEVVIKIVEMHVPGLDGEQKKNLIKVIEFEKRVRQIATETMLPYTPSLRETIAFAKLLKSGVDAKTAVRLVYVNAYYQWGGEVVQKIEEAVGSIFGY